MIRGNEKDNCNESYLWVTEIKLKTKDPAFRC